MNRKTARVVGIAGFGGLWLAMGAAIFFVPEWAGGGGTPGLYWRAAGLAFGAVAVAYFLSPGLRVWLGAQYAGSAGTDEESAASPEDKLEVNALRVSEACRDRASAARGTEVRLTGEHPLEYVEADGRLFALIPAWVRADTVMKEVEELSGGEQVWAGCSLVAAYDGSSWHPTPLSVLEWGEGAAAELSRLWRAAEEEDPGVAGPARPG